MQSQGLKSQLWSALFGVLAVVAMGAVLWFVFRTNLSGAAVATGTVPPSTQPSVTANPYPGPSQGVSTPDLTATQSSIETRVAWANAEGTRAIQEFTTSPQPSLTPFVTGTREKDNSAFHWRKFGFETENEWVGYVNGREVVIWVGALISDPSQGGVQVSYKYPERTLLQQFLTTEKRGSLHVVAETNNRLTLVSTQGVTFYFDVPGFKFVSSLEEVVPTATPLPTFTIPAPLPTVPLPTGYPNQQPTAQSTPVP